MDKSIEKVVSGVEKEQDENISRMAEICAQISVLKTKAESMETGFRISKLEVEAVFLLASFSVKCRSILNNVMGSDLPLEKKKVVVLKTAEDMDKMIDRTLSIL